MTFTRWFEVARIVKDIVFRQQGFIGKANELPIADYGSGVKEPAPGRRIVGSDCSDNCRHSFSGGDDLLQRLQNAARHIAIEKPIERGVALHAGFGHYDDIRGVLFALLNRANNAPGIAFVIAVGAVYLPDSYAHLKVKLVFEACLRGPAADCLLQQRSCTFP